MTFDISPTGQVGFIGDDRVLPFQVEGLDVRGRAVTLGPLTDAILNRHDYPAPVARLLSETIALTVLLGTSLKFEGKLIIQTQTDGPVNFLVADFTAPDGVRAYARFDAEAVGDAIREGRTEPHELLGRGVLAFTIDQGPHTQRYQGIVELTGERLDDCVRHYFAQSEQLATGILVDVGLDAAGRWHGGAVMVQALPEADAATNQGARSSHVEDDWRRAMALLSTATPEELRGTADAEGRALGINEVLFRLFHEEAVRVYDPHALQARCRCSRDKVASVLGTIPRIELADLKIDDAVEVTCEFCNTTYRFTDADLDALSADAAF